MSKPKIGDSDSDDLDYLDDILNQAETKYKSRDNNESGELRESDLKNSKTLLKSRKSIEQMSDTSYDAFYSESERPSIGR